MSVKKSDLLHQQIAAGDFEQAENTAHLLSGNTSISQDEFFRYLRHAVNARQSRLVDILAEGNPQFFALGVDAVSLQQFMEEISLLLAACRREKMNDQAHMLVGLVLRMLEKQTAPIEQPALTAVAKFADISGRYALRRKDIRWFDDIAGQTMGWASRYGQGRPSGLFLPVLDSWMHRINRLGLVDALPVFFEAVFLLYLAETDKEDFIAAFLLEWRSVTTIASLNPVSPMASEWVEQLLLLTIRTENGSYWRQVTQRIGEVASLAVTKHDIQASLPIFRPLLDVGRVNLSDELKFGSGPDPASLRQRIIRLVCDETLKIVDMAARTDISAVAGDKIEEVYHSWINDPAYESQSNSIRRFCQLLLIYWSMNRKRAARKWTPREKKLSEPLLTDEERAKLTFLL